MHRGEFVIRGATVVDGSGAPGRRADIAVADGRVTEVAESISATDTAVVDAGGLVVTPGFVDVHTHFDAQLMFEPTASPSSWHGVTTVVTGNCGFSLAPTSSTDVPWHLDMLARVEGMSAEALAAGVDFSGGTMADLLGHLDGRIGVNAAPLVGHCAIRRYVMGPDASHRTATAHEIERMQQVLHDSLQAGAAGFSSSQLDVHADHEGLPVPSNLAAPDELVALAAVLAAHPGRVIEFVPGSSLPGYSTTDAQVVLDMARASNAAVNVNIIDRFPGFTDSWEPNLELAERAAAEGLRVVPMFRCNPQDLVFALADTFIFDDVPSVRDALRLPAGEREAVLADPDRRRAMRADLDTVRRSISFAWSDVSVMAVHSAELGHAEGRSVTDAAADAGVDPLDWLLDLALADDLRTVFRIARGLGPGHRELVGRLVQHPLLMPGASDAGAHLLTFCGADYTTRLLTDFVPGPLSFEQAVATLTSRPAAMLGLHDRGVVRPGAAADLVLLDPDTLGVGRTHFVDDFPVGSRRLVHESRGYVAVYVNGELLLDGGTPTGAVPGRLVHG